MEITLKDIKTNKVLQRLIGVMILTVMLVVGFGFTVKNNIAVKKQINDQRAIVMESQSRLTYLKNLALDEVKMQEEIESLRELLPVGINQDQLLDFIQTLCDEHNVVTNQINFENTEVVGEIGKLPFNISVTGGYREVMAMLENLSTQGRLIVIENMDVVGNGELVSADATLGAYYQ